VRELRDSIGGCDQVADDLGVNGAKPEMHNPGAKSPVPCGGSVNASSFARRTERHLGPVVPHWNALHHGVHLSPASLGFQHLLNRGGPACSHCRHRRPKPARTHRGDRHHHRMLICHFGSREGLLVAVCQAVEEQQRAALLESGITPQTAWQSWQRLSDPKLWPQEHRAGVNEAYERFLQHTSTAAAPTRASC
jgi:hypothetical protein